MAVFSTEIDIRVPGQGRHSFDNVIKWLEEKAERFRAAQKKGVKLHPLSTEGILFHLSTEDPDVAADFGMKKVGEYVTQARPGARKPRRRKKSV